MHRTPALAGFVCAAVLSPAGARQQAASAAGCLLCSNSESTSSYICRSSLPGCRTPALKGFVCTALPHRQNTRSSPHSRPALTLASACIRSQMRLSTCPAPHSSPGGLRLCSKCFRPLVQGNRLHPQQVAFYAVSLQLHLPLFTAKGRTPALKGFVCTTLPHRQSTPSSPHSRPAVTLAAACIRSQMRLSTCLAPHSSPGGLRLCSKCFRPLVHGNRLHPQQVAFFAARLDLHTDQHSQALHSALRAPFAQQCFRSTTQQPAFAPS